MAEGNEQAVNLDSRAALAKQSKVEAERLIEEFKPFLRNRVARYSLHHDEYHREELFSSALLAFYESIQNYDAEKGHFFPFANQVVCKRLIDHIRKTYKTADKIVSLEEDDERQSAQSAMIENISTHIYEAESRQAMLVEEIEQFKSELKAWGITMEMLSEQSPKHKALRDTYKAAVKKISESPDIMQTILLKHYFPISAVVKITKIPQKKLERARTFIIASLIIKTGDYDLLSDYVDGRG